MNLIRKSYNNRTHEKLTVVVLHAILRKYDLMNIVQELQNYNNAYVQMIYRANACH